MTVTEPRDVGEEARRLEALWGGRFGDDYVARNLTAARGREAFWAWLLRAHPVQSVLEIGCNIGANLQWIAGAGRHVVGVDVNHGALQRLRHGVAGVDGVLAAARTLPFRSAAFDLVFTAGVLIHQPEAALPAVIDEMVRCARRYVACMEYFAETTVEVPYRGERDALFKRDYGGLLAARWPGLALRGRGELHRDAGWDDVTYWLFEKTAER